MTGAAVRALCSVVLFAALASCTSRYHPKTREELLAIAKLIHESMPDTEVTKESQEEASEKALVNLGLGNLSANDLSELRNIYSGRYLEPKLEDSISEGMSRIIKSRISKAVRMWTDSKRYEPCEVYVINSFDPKTYQSHLENAYADDSIYIPEFPENYGNRTIPYKETSQFRIEMETPFATVVGPYFYIGQSWRVGNVIRSGENFFALPPNFHQTVVFVIVEDKQNPQRQYKVLWVVDSIS